MALEYVFIGNMEETKENQQLRFNDPKEFAELLDKHAGNNIINRMFKLREEYHELLEAWHDLEVVCRKITTNAMKPLSMNLQMSTPFCSILQR